MVIEIEPHNLANVVDGVGSGEGSFREQDIERQEQASIPKKTMKPACAISIIANDLTVIINSDFGKIGTRELNDHQLKLVGSKSFRRT